MRVSNYPALADRVRGDLRDRDALARLPRAGTCSRPCWPTRSASGAMAASAHRRLDCARVKPALNDARSSAASCWRPPRSPRSCCFRSPRSASWRVVSRRARGRRVRPHHERAGRRAAVGTARWIVIAAVVFTCWWAAVPAPLSIVLLAIIVIVWLAFAVLRQARTLGHAAVDLVAPIYIGAPLGMLVALQSSHGPKATLLVIATSSSATRRSTTRDAHSGDGRSPRPSAQRRPSRAPSAGC